MNPSAKPLTGFSILDVTNVLSGPFCGYQLGLLGADVIKVEALDGDLARQLGANADWSAQGMGISFLAQNAGKQSIALNLKTEAGRDIFKTLVAKTDALIENFRPGVMDRLGLGFEALKQVRDPLIYCAISGFGQTGPLVKQPAYDQIIQGMAGIMSVTGASDSEPYRVGYPVADTIGGLTAAFAITAALHQKQSQFIDVSMLESVLTTMGWVASNWLMAGVPGQRLGNDNMTAAPSGAFHTQDGLINIAANQQRQWEALARTVGLDALIEDPRFATREARKTNRALLTNALEAALIKDTTHAWVDQLTAVGVPAGPVLTVSEALSLDQVRGRGFIATVDQGSPAKTIDLVTNGFMINGERATPNGSVETLGESANTLLHDLGFTEQEISALQAEGVVR